MPSERKNIEAALRYKLCFENGTIIMHGLILYVLSVILAMIGWLTGGWSSQPTKLPTNLPANQPTSQSTNLPTNQLTNQPINQSSNQPINQPANQLVNQPTSQPTNQPTSQSTKQPGRGHVFVEYLSFYEFSVHSF